MILTCFLEYSALVANKRTHSDGRFHAVRRRARLSELP